MLIIYLTKVKLEMEEETNFQYSHSIGTKKQLMITQPNNFHYSRTFKQRLILDLT